MTLIKLLLNLPWSILWLIGALISVPKSAKISKNPPALIINVRTLAVFDKVPGHKGTRAGVLGNVVLLGPKLLDKDLEHELIHVEQMMRRPLIQPLLNLIEDLRHGHKNNRYELEAYKRAGNKYLG